MKYYGVFKDGQRIKKYGLHRTYTRALCAFYGPIEEFFDGLIAECRLMDKGYQIKVTAETE